VAIGLKRRSSGECGIKTFRPKSTKNASENSKRSDEITRQHRVITEEFETLFSPFVNCVAYSLIESGDRRYLFSQMSPIRPLIGAIYTNLIRIDDLKQKNGNEDDINAARKRLSIVISELNGDRINRNVTMPIRNYASYFGIKNCDGVKRFSIPLEIENSSISALPYLATIYASLLYMDGQKQEAIDTINEYIIHLREHNGNFDVDMPEYWYLSRAMVNLFYMAEDFIQSEEKELPLRIRNLYLDNLDEYFALIKKIDERIPFQQIFSDYKFGGSAGHSLVEVKFRANPGFLKSCPNDEDSTFRELPLSVKDYATFSYIYLTLQSLYTFRSLDRPDFDTVAKKTTHLADAVVNIDLSCAIELDLAPRVAVRQQRALFLYIYALHQEKLTNIKQRIGSSYENWTRERLDMIEHSAELALEVLAENDPSDLKEYSLDDEQDAIDRDLRNLLERTKARISLLQ